MSLQYDDLARTQTAHPPTFGQQGQVTNPEVANVITPAAPAGGALPPLTPVQQPPQQQPSGDPMTIFNTKLMEMLTQAKSQSNAPLYNQANHLATTQTDNSMKPAGDLGIAGLAPGDALGARKAAAGVYDPEIRNLNDRISLNNENISKFESAIKAAQDFGDSYSKYVKADDATVQAVKQQMAAGFLPSATVLDKVGKFLTADDWNALSEAKKTTDTQPNSYKEYSLTTSTPTPQGYAAWLDRQSQYKGSSGPGAPSTVTERTMQSQSKIVSSAIAALKAEKAGSENHYANPETWLDQLSAYIGANGTPADFLASVPPERYLSNNDASYAVSLAKRQTTNSVANPFSR